MGGMSRSSISNHDGGTVGAGHDEECHLAKDEYNLIQKVLRQNLMFRDLNKQARRALVLAFERMEIEKGHVIYRQGDDCENGCVYIVGEGECDVSVDGIVVPGPYGVFKPKSMFGELGVLYNANRASTVSAKSDQVVLYRAAGSAFTTAFHQEPPPKSSKREERELKEIDKAINELSGTKTLYGGDIIRQYDPDRFWLWRQYQGTILQHNIMTTLIAILLSAAFCLIVEKVLDPTWEVGHAPDEDHPLIRHLALFQKVWLYQMTLTTFILTFYLNQAYTFWQQTNVTMRQIQGRISDFLLSLATSAKRNEDGTYTIEAEAMMEDIAASSRLFHALYWAKVARRFQCLSSSTGLARMAQRGMVTPKQLEVLKSLNTPDNTKYNACLEWMMIRACQGIEQDVFYNADPLSHQLLDLMCQLRASTARMTDSLSTRMPMAYTHFVQLLVDTFVWTSPFALYAGTYAKRSPDLPRA